MKGMTSIQEFDNYRQLILEQEKQEKPCVVISAGTCGQASGANDLIRWVKRYIVEKNLQNKVSLRITGCLGFCEIEPYLLIEPGDNIYPDPKAEDIPKIINAALKGDVVEKLLYSESKSKAKIRSMEDIPFFKNQHQSLLGKNKQIDPIKISNYIENGGYSAFAKVIAKPDPVWIIKEVTRAELRGRGGAGFFTGQKWEFARNSANGKTQKYVVCNADEGDPGAYMDRSLLEGNPHSVIEGMIIAGIAVGATKGFIYVRSEYPLAIKHTLIALRQARELGILGNNIMGSEIDFDLEIIRGAGAFVCGEETALLKSIEGMMGHPKQRPPYPVVRGLWGQPTSINNVETLANIPDIINKGATEYKKIGVAKNRGTKIFSLVGKIKNTGLAEVPLGTTIKEVVYKIGGGPSGNKKIKAIQTGGPSGGCIPEKLFDLPIDYESLTKVGSIMGSGGMIVMDEGTCMVDVARYFTNFLEEESCGKCSICREGTQRMNEILTRITEGKGKEEDLQLLEELGQALIDTAMCGLGQTAPNPMLSTLKYFRDEYLAHIRDKKCPAGVCKALIEFEIDPKLCTGCGLCEKNCPENAIIGKLKETFTIVTEKCIKCGICRDVCKFNAVLT